ncbi:MAG: hypothetical protein JNG84_08740 [Archangium sp.]|nr:hypothetical protein [Archangium sp.]
MVRRSMSDSPTVTLGLPVLVLLVASSALPAGAIAWWLKQPVPPPPPAAPVECTCRCEHSVVVPPAPAPVPMPSPIPTPPQPDAPIDPSACRGMTWSLLKQEKTVARVGSDPAHTNAYVGDTSCDEERSLLCLIPKNLPKPEGLESSFYSGWSGAQLAVTTPVSGRQLTSREAADALCAKAFGDGWRMAEHHDGRGGWGLTGVGEMPKDIRFWVAINDQPANPWSVRRSASPR